MQSFSCVDPKALPCHLLIRLGVGLDDVLESYLRLIDTSHDPPMSELCIELAVGDPSENVSGLLVSRTLLMPLLFTVRCARYIKTKVNEDQRAAAKEQKVKRWESFGATLPAIFVPMVDMRTN